MNKHVLTFIALFGVLIVSRTNGQKMNFESYDPPSTLVVPEHKLTRAKFPFIDVHNHQGDMASAQALETLITEMEKLNMAVMVNLSGRGFRGGVDHIEKSIETIRKYHPKRFVVFTNVEFGGIDDPEWQTRMVKRLEDEKKERRD